jgi:hypothetical protein
MIVGWEDYGTGDNDLYAQRVSAAGSVLWTTNGLGVSVGGGGHFGASMAGDGAGGVFIDWNDDNDYILAQRVSAGGTLPWGTAGVTVCDDPNYPSNGPLVSDGAGGVICAWLDFRDPLNIGVYSQRLDSNGAAQWTANGVSIASHGTAGAYPEGMVTDGSHGAIVLMDVSYLTSPGGPYADSLLLQRVDASGAPQWGVTGAVAVALGLATGDVQLVPDGLAGAIVAWEDERSPQVDLYAQRVNGAGAPQWTANGALVCDAADWQLITGLAGDGAGGAFLSWADSRGHGYYDLYAQHLSSSGASLWTANGLAVASAPRGQYGGGIVADGAGGAIAGWTDNRAGNARYVYAQRIQSNGAVQWATDGVTSVLASLVSANIEAGRASLEWQVSSAGPVRIERATEAEAWSAIAVREPDGDGMVRFDDTDVAAGGRYGYRLIVSGEHGEAAAGEIWLEAPSTLALALESPRPNPVRGALVMAFTLPDGAPARLELFDVRGRRMMIREVGGLGAGRHLLRLDQAVRQSGVYFARLTRGGQVCRTRVVRVE